jgi:heptaprenyl diphosphate synthase
MMNNRLSTMAMMITLATLMASVETMIQSPLPLLRLGLANGITLLVLKWYGFRSGLLVTLARVCLAGLITGRLFQPVFLLSFSGGLSAVLIMALVIPLENRWFSLIGISILGAFFHNLAQLAAASLLIHRVISPGFLPLVFLVTLITGSLIGYFAILIDQTAWHNRLISDR